MKDYISKICLALSLFILCICSLLAFKLFMRGAPKGDEDDALIAIAETFEEPDSEESEELPTVTDLVDSSSDVVGAKGDLQQSDEDSSASVKEEDTQSRYSWFSVDQKRGTMYATSSVNIRALPTVDSDKIGLLAYGKEIEISGICNNGWYQVVYGGGEAYISGNYLSDSKPESVSVPSYSGFIVNDGGVADKCLFKLEANYLKIPENVRNSFQNNGWSIICTTDKLGEKFFSPNISIQAVTDSATKTIWVEAREAAMTSILHEIGHYIDWQCGWVSMTKTFGDIWRDEVDTFKSIITTNDNNTSSPSEYFAEAYQISLEYPDLLSQYCPQTYEYVVSYASSLD